MDGEAQVLLYRDGVLIETLSRGLHVFWKGTGKVQWKEIDLRELVADVAGQEIMTNDKVTLRVNLLVTWQIVDSLKSVTVVADAAQSLYRDAQLVLRAAVGTRPLDALLADKESVGNEVREALSKRSAEYGVAVRGVGLRDIILPGDMKLLLNQVIAATKEAEANLIRRREETAAARSQANTAKLLAENPQLARLKELELLHGMLAGAKTTFVFGQGDIAEQVRSLVGQENAKATRRGRAIEESVARLLFFIWLDYAGWGSPTRSSLLCLQIHRPHRLFFVIQRLEIRALGNQIQQRDIRRPEVLRPCDRR